MACRLVLKTGVFLIENNCDPWGNQTASRSTGVNFVMHWMNKKEYILYSIVQRHMTYLQYPVLITARKMNFFMTLLSSISSTIMPTLRTQSLHLYNRQENHIEPSHYLTIKSISIIGFWIHNVKINISLRMKVETCQTFRSYHMDLFDGRVVWSHDGRVTWQEME